MIIEKHKETRIGSRDYVVCFEKARIGLVVAIFVEHARVACVCIEFIEHLWFTEITDLCYQAVVAVATWRLLLCPIVECDFIEGNAGWCQIQGSKHTVDYDTDLHDERYDGPKQARRHVDYRLARLPNQLNGQAYALAQKHKNQEQNKKYQTHENAKHKPRILQTLQIGQIEKLFDAQREVRVGKWRRIAVPQLDVAVYAKVNAEAQQAHHNANWEDK